MSIIGISKFIIILNTYSLELRFRCNLLDLLTAFMYGLWDKRKLWMQSFFPKYPFDKIFLG